MTVHNAVVRKAWVSDAPVIAEIVNSYAEEGIMLQRPLSRIYDNIRDYVVVEDKGTVFGCGALHVMWSDLAEIRSIAIREEHAGSGYGRILAEELLREAGELGIERVFVLTYQDDFFARLGFTVMDKMELPHKIWNECINCVHFPNCDETAMILRLK